jgi:hypothetical protein
MVSGTTSSPLVRSIADDDPFRGALLDGMDRVAGRRLKDLGKQAVGITGEHIAQRG